MAATNGERCACGDEDVIDGADVGHQCLIEIAMDLSAFEHEEIGA